MFETDLANDLKFDFNESCKKGKDAKIAVTIFLVYILLCSDAWLKILRKGKAASSAGIISSYGIVVNACVLTLVFLCLSRMIDHDFI